MENAKQLLEQTMAAFALSSFAGIASMLRSDTKITRRAFFAAFMYSGALGTAMFLFLFDHFDGHLETLIGLCGLAGIGGVSVVDAVVQLAKHRFGITLSIQKHDK